MHLFDIFNMYLYKISIFLYFLFLLMLNIKELIIMEIVIGYVMNTLCMVIKLVKVQNYMKKHKILICIITTIFIVSIGTLIPNKNLYKFSNLIYKGAFVDNKNDDNENKTICKNINYWSCTINRWCQKPKFIFT